MSSSLVMFLSRSNSTFSQSADELASFVFLALVDSPDLPPYGQRSSEVSDATNGDKPYVAHLTDVNFIDLTRDGKNRIELLRDSYVKDVWLKKQPRWQNFEGNKMKFKNLNK